MIGAEKGNKIYFRVAKEHLTNGGVFSLQNAVIPNRLNEVVIEVDNSE